MHIPEALASTASALDVSACAPLTLLASGPGHGWAVVNGRRLRDYRAPRAAPSAPSGRTGSCRSCGAEVSGRADAVYCSDRCSKRARRRSARGTPRQTPIAKALRASRYLVGRVSHTVDLWALMVPRATAAEELSALLPVPVTDADLKAAMREAGILDYGDTLPEVAKGLRKTACRAA